MIIIIAAKYERTEESLKEDVKSLKQWMTTQPHLPEILDESSIQNFFILNKCSIERTKRSIDMYYTIRSQIPEFYENSNPKCDRIKKLMKIQGFVPIPNLTKDMYRILVHKILDKSLIDTLKDKDMMALGLNLQEVRMKEDIIFGDLIIFDMEGLDFGWFAKMTPSFVARAFAAYEKIYSIPMKGLYLVNCPSLVNTLMAIMKSLLKPKLFERIHVCADTSILREAFPKELLPKDYGGEEKSVEELNELMKIKLNQYQDRFDHLDGLQVNECLRPEKLKNDEILGFYGNFKKLNVD